MAPAGPQPVPVPVGVAATIRDAVELHARLLQALAEGGDVRVDCSQTAEADATFLQIILSAARTAATFGAGVAFSPPPSAAVLAVWTQCGLPPLGPDGMIPINAVSKGNAS